MLFISAVEEKKTRMDETLARRMSWARTTEKKAKPTVARLSQKTLN